MQHETQNSPPFRAFVIVRIGTVAALAIAAVAAFSSPGRAAVFGSDDRAPLTSADADLRDKIGTLVSSHNGAFCTAFCVAPDVIATASHCLYGTAATPGPNLKDLTFKTASSGPVSVASPGTPLARSRVTLQSQKSQTVISGTTRLRTAPPIGAAQDWAVARLDAPACKSGGLRLSERTSNEVITAAKSGALYQIAVHADLPDSKLRRGMPCAVHSAFPNADEAAIARDFAAPDKIVFHTCDTGGGSSGSPMLIDTPAGPEVVAINVGTYVLSRAVTTAKEPGIRDGNAAPASEPIANTAIAIGAIKAALAQFSKLLPQTGKE